MRILLPVANVIPAAASVTCLEPGSVSLWLPDNCSSAGQTRKGIFCKERITFLSVNKKEGTASDECRNTKCLWVGRLAATGIGSAPTPIKPVIDDNPQSLNHSLACPR